MAMVHFGSGICLSKILQFLLVPMMTGKKPPDTSYIKQKVAVVSTSVSAITPITTEGVW